MPVVVTRTVLLMTLSLVCGVVDGASATAPDIHTLAFVTDAMQPAFAPTRAFAVTPWAGFAVASVLATSATMLLLLMRALRRDRAATEVRPADGPEYQPLVRVSDGWSFAAPAGVRPGQVGTVVDEEADLVDLAATVLDLAVRNYLWITERAVEGPPERPFGGPGDVAGHQPAGGWLVVVRNPPDRGLRPYERAVFQALMSGRAHVAVPGPMSRLTSLLPTIRSALYDEMVSSGWFCRRPGGHRSRLRLAGLATFVFGVLLTGVLATSASHGLLGVAVTLAGATVALFAARFPARCARGSELLAQLVMVRAFLREAPIERFAPPDRSVLFSRCLPYAVTLRETQRWLAAYTAAQGGGEVQVEWYGTGPLPAAVLAQRLTGFVEALTGMVLDAAHLRALSRS